MSKADKLIDAVRNNPRHVRYEDACRVAELFGFVRRNPRSSTSHAVYARPGIPEILNFQRAKDGKAKRYQVDQLLALIDKYNLEAK